MRYFTQQYFAGAGGRHDHALANPNRALAEKYRAEHPGAQFSYSYLMMRILELRLHKSLSNVSWLQQSNEMRAHSEAVQYHGVEKAKEIMAEHRQLDERAQAENEEIARDFVMAITGKEIEFVQPAAPEKPKYNNLAMIGRTPETKDDPGGWVNYDGVMGEIAEMERYALSWTYERRPEAERLIKPLAEIEKQVILDALHRLRGHRVRTATALGIGVRTLAMKLKRWREQGDPAALQIVGRIG
jgi:hypothetical protein